MNGMGGDPNTPAVYNPQQGGQCDPNLVQACVAALQQTDTFRQLQAMLPMVSQLVQMLGGGQQTGIPGMGGQPGMGGGDPMMAMLQQLQSQPGQTMPIPQGGGGQGQTQPGQQANQNGDKLNMAGQPGQGSMSVGSGSGYGWGYPSPSGSNIPGYLQQPQRSDMIPQPIHHTRYMRQGETPEQTICRMGAELEQAIRFARQAIVSVELAQLQQEGYILDPNEEIPELIQLDDNERKVRYQRMRLRYTKATNQQTRQPVQSLLPGYPQQVPQVPQQQYSGQMPVPQIPGIPGYPVMPGMPVPQVPYRPVVGVNTPGLADIAPSTPTPNYAAQQAYEALLQQQLAQQQQQAQQQYPGQQQQYPGQLVNPMQVNPADPNRPMSREEKDAIVEATEQMRVQAEKTGQRFEEPNIFHMLRLLRSGQLVRFSRNGVPERVM